MKKHTIYMLGPSIATKGGISSVLAFYQKQLTPQCDVRFIATYSGEHRVLDFLFFGISVVRVLCIAACNKFSVFHIHAATGGSFLRKSILEWIVTRFHRTCIVHIHGADYDEFIKTAKPGLKKCILWFLDQADAIIVLSQSWRDIFSQYAEDSKIHVIGNPARTIIESITPADPSLPLRMIFTGLIGARKGAYDVVKALSELKDRDWKLDIFGNGEVSQIRENIAALGMTEQVTVYDWVNHSELITRYPAYQVQLLPSRSEGQPMSLLEGMGSGLALIASRVGGIPELLVDGFNGIMVSPGNIEEIKMAIAHCIDHREDVERMRLNSLQRAKDMFSGEVITAKLFTVYRSLNVEI